MCLYYIHHVYMYVLILSTCVQYKHIYVYMCTYIHMCYHMDPHVRMYITCARMCMCLYHIFIYMYVSILYVSVCIYANNSAHAECSFHLLYVSTYVCIYIIFIHMYTSILYVSVCKHQHTRGMLISFIICISTCMYLYYILILYSSTCIYFYYMYPNLNNSTHTECSFHLSYVPAYVCIYMIFMHMYLFCISKFKQQRTRGMLISLVLVFVVGIAGKISEKCNLQSYYIVNLVADRLLRISSTGLRDGHRR